MEPEGSLQRSQEPATNPYPEPDESNPHLSTLFPLTSTVILFPHLRLGLTSGTFPSDFPTKILYAFLTFPMHATFPVHLIPLDGITFRNKLFFYGEELLGPRPTKLQDHSLSAIRYCLFNIFAAALHIWSSGWAIKRYKSGVTSSHTMFIYRFINIHELPQQILRGKLS
jgi:hypothetical protein